MSAFADEIKEAVREVLREELPRMLRERVVQAEEQPATAAPHLLTVRQASANVSRCPETIRRAISRGDLRASKPTGSREWLISECDLSVWASAGTRKISNVVDFDSEVNKAVARVRNGP